MSPHVVTLDRSAHERTIALAQVLAGDLMLADRERADVILCEFRDHLPQVTNSLERLVLRQLLLDVAFRSGKTLHTMVHFGDSRQCLFSEAALLAEFLSTGDREPAEQFEKWRLALTRDLNLLHPPSLASSIGRLVRRNVQTSWTMGALARRYHVTPSQIRRRFHAEFGMSVGEYQRLARLSAALTSLRANKLAAVALSVGIRSPKNFYRAFARLVGISPAEYRSMPDEAASDVHIKLQRRLLRNRRNGSSE